MTFDTVERFNTMPRVSWHFGVSLEKIGLGSAGVYLSSVTDNVKNGRFQKLRTDPLVDSLFADLVFRLYKHRKTLMFIIFTFNEMFNPYF